MHKQLTTPPSSTGRRGPARPDSRRAAPAAEPGRIAEPRSRPFRRPSRAPASGAPLTVAQVVSRFGGGGAERLAYNLAVGLGARGLRSAAVALRTADLGGPALDGVEVVELGAVRGKIRTAARAVLQFRRLLRERKIDIVHAHGCGNNSALLFCALVTLGLRRRPRLVFTLHNPESVLAERGPRLALLRWALRRCDRIFCPSREMATTLTSRARLARPAEAFRNGVAAAEPARPLRQGAPVIAWAARMVPSKNPQLLIRAAARLRSQGAEFRVILAGAAPASLKWYEDQTRRLVQDLGVQDIVSMPGWARDTPGLFAGASIAVQSSVTEGLSLSLLEQMMAGLAVVATDVGDTSTAIQDGVTGLLIPPENETALVTALARLLREPELRSRLGRRARARALNQFTLAHMADHAAAEYARVVAAR